MKIVLMVAAGVAVGLTVVVAVLVQVLMQLAPVLAVVALAVLVLRLVLRRGSDRGVRDQTWGPHPVPAQPPAAAPFTPALPSSASDPMQELHLQWGPPAHENLDAIPIPASAPRAGTQIRRPRAGNRPSRVGRGHRP